MKAHIGVPGQQQAIARVAAGARFVPQNPDNRYSAGFGSYGIQQAIAGLAETAEGLASIERAMGNPLQINARALRGDGTLGDVGRCAAEAIRSAYDAFDAARALTPVSAYTIDGRFSGIAFRNAAVLASQESNLPFNLQQR